MSNERAVPSADDRDESILPDWVKPGAMFVYTGKAYDGRKFHVRGIVDGMAVIRFWRPAKRRWQYIVEDDLYFEAFAGVIKVVSR